MGTKCEVVTGFKPSSICRKGPRASTEPPPPTPIDASFSDWFFSLADLGKERVTKTELLFCKKGVPHGFYHSWNEGGSNASFGVYLNGKESGPWWKCMPGGGYLYWTPSKENSNSDQTEQNSSSKGSEAAFLYPDLETVLRGNFRGDEMIRATEVRTKSVSTSPFGIPIVTLSDGDHRKHPFTREDPPRGREGLIISTDPLAPDPYESKFVEVKESSIPGAGQGLFAKRPIPLGQLVAYFNGVRRTDESVAAVSDSCRSDYSISWKREELQVILDIPEDMRHLEKYCCTLGHKVCHSFTPNATYGYAFHPRFGDVRSVMALRAIEAGEEITCDYKYSLKKDPPFWYLHSLEEHLKSTLGLTLAE